MNECASVLGIQVLPDPILNLIVEPFFAGDNVGRPKAWKRQKRFRVARSNCCLGSQ